jgi:hypothetical protein
MKPRLTTTKPEVNMKLQDKMSGSSGMMRLMYTVILGAVLCCAQAGVALAASVTISVQDASAVANDTAHVPVTIQLASELTTGDVSVNLQVMAQGGAPAVGKLTFTDGDLGSESAFNNDTNGIYIGTWFSKPQTGGTINLGTLNVPIPSSAQSGQTYQVFIQTAEVDQPDGSTPYEDINFSSTAVVTVGGPPVTPATATPTLTPTSPPPTATSTSTPTTAATATLTPTVTPKVGTPTPTTGGGGVCPTCDDDDGCQIGASGHGAAWLLLIPAIGLLVVRRRLR